MQMPRLKLVGLVGSFNKPSRTYSLVDFLGQVAEDRYGLESEIYDLADIGPSLGQAQRYDQLDGHAQHLLQKVIEADVLVIGSPTYKGSYPGLFKHLIDLIDPLALKGKPVLLSATGGGDRHALMVEHQLRPLFGFFMAHTLPSAVYASDRDFLDYRLVSEPARARAEQAVAELAAFVPLRHAHVVAAE
jgi:FMN reductase